MKKNIFFLAVIGLLFGNYVQAAGVFLEPKIYFEDSQKFYEIKVFLNADKESINTLKGEILYSEQDFDFKKIMDGNSIISFWIKNPQKISDGKIVFSGGMPGGYNGEKGFLFSAVFNIPDEEKLPDQREILITNIKAYLNDSKGSEKNISDVKISVDSEKAEVVQLPSDQKAPEVFAPYVTRDPNLANGQWVVILNAQDKGKGIDHYEVFESAKKYKSDEILNNKSLPWQTVKDQGAYVLHDQNLESYIYIKAVDKDKNERVAIVVPAFSKEDGYFDYKSISVIIILSIILLIVFLELFFFRKRKYE